MTLHEQILAEIERREKVALAARGPIVGMTEQVRAYWDAHDSADALHRYAHYRKVLERHAPIWVDGWSQDIGEACSHEWGDGDGYTIAWDHCPDVLDVAEALGIES